MRSDDPAPAAGLELNDRSYEEEGRQQRGAFVDEDFASARLPLLNFPVQ